jgi:hypothetical protein
LNIIDAIKSGKPIRRSGKDIYSAHHLSHGATSSEMLCSAKDGHWLDAQHYIEFYICKRDILADDWEIQEPTVTITRSQFFKIWFEYFGNLSDGEDMASKLGLGE